MKLLRVGTKGKEIAEGLQKFLDNNNLSSIFYVSGNEWIAGNLCYHLKPRPKCLILYGKEEIEVVAGEAILVFKSHELESLK